MAFLAAAYGYGAIAAPLAFGFDLAAPLALAAPFGAYGFGLAAPAALLL